MTARPGATTGMSERLRASEACVRVIENAIGVLALRLRGTDVLPGVTSVDLAKMIVLDAGILLDHFTAEAK